MRHGLKTGDLAPEFSLIGADAMIHTLVDYKGYKGTCFCFITLGCQKSDKAIEEFKRLQELYRQKSIAFVGICIRQDETFRECLKALKAFNVDFDLLVDGTGDLSSKFDIEIVPHTFIFNQSKHLIYSGAILNETTGQNYVEAALDELVGGLPISCPWTEVDGSRISRLSFV